ncbi:alpha-L-fucosidase [Fulvivirgaceae bacterium BMA10]|uniref:alpha-L-fucosidase n=1 Tax=Splendidivirga corallicola TaxID=3051826 RepID=A0ABT8KRI1_9BACT|nr:alpha-L-fucosidase [Fulvivirgaceae bacterium BMA10]
MKSSSIVIALVLFILTISNCQKRDIEPEEQKEQEFNPNLESLGPWQPPQWFEDAVLGFYIHWGPYSVPGFAFLDPSERVDSGIWYGGCMYEPDGSLGCYEFHKENYGDPCDFGYHDLLPLFKAENWDPDRWASLYKHAGADFAGVCAEHGDGFPMWDTKYDSYNVMNHGPKRDVLGEMFAAARRQGMKTIATIHEHPGSIYANAKELCPESANDPQYKDLYELSSSEELYNKVIELVDNYQPNQLWFETAEIYGEQRWADFVSHYYTAAQNWESGAVITQKSRASNLLSHTALDIEGGEFPGGIWEWRGETEPQQQRWQKDVPIGNYWAYAEGVGCRPVNMLVDGIVDRISKNGVTLLNMAPKADGTFPQEQIDCLQELGNWMQVNKEALYAAKPAHFVEGGIDIWSNGTFRFMEKGNYLYAVDLGNVWPTDRGFADYEDSTKPTAPIKIKGAVPIPGSVIRMLGSDEDLSWHMEGSDLVIDELPQSLPGDYAWSFKIQISE